MKSLLALLVIIFSHLSFAAAFNATDGLINIPIAKHFRPGEIQAGGSFGYNGSPSIQLDLIKAI